MKTQMGRAIDRYMARRAMGPTFVALYCLVAIVLTANRAGTELFPFFNWSLFSSSSNPKSDTVIIIRSVNGVELAQPRLFYDMKETFSSANSRTSRVGKTLDRWAAAVVTHDEATERNLRKLVEGTYLREAKTLRYDVAWITYDPIERLRTGQTIKTRVLASYEKR